MDENKIAPSRRKMGAQRTTGNHNSKQAVAIRVRRNADRLDWTTRVQAETPEQAVFLAVLTDSRLRQSLAEPSDTSENLRRYASLFPGLRLEICCYTSRVQLTAGLMVGDRQRTLYVYPQDNWWDLVDDNGCVGGSTPQELAEFLGVSCA